MSFQTGTPRTVTANIGVSNSDGEDRPDVMGNTSVSPPIKARTTGSTLHAFQTAVPGTYGNAGRNIITTAGVSSVDLSAFKNFAITERAKLQFRAEAFQPSEPPEFSQRQPEYNLGIGEFWRILGCAAFEATANGA